MTNKKGVLNVIGGIALVALIAFGVFWAMGSSDGSFTLDKDGENLADVQCESGTTPTLTIRSYDKDNVGTALTEATNVYRKVGDTSWTTFTAGTGFEVNVNDKYEILMGATAADQTDNAYGEHFTTSPISCQEQVTIEKAVYNDEIETSLSATFYNADGDAGAETFVAGQSQTVSLKLAAGSDEYFGNPNAGSYPNIVCMDLNSSAWDKPEKVTFDGKSMDSVSIPQVHAGLTGHSSYCYQAPAIDDSIMEDNRYLIRLNADDTNAPTSDDIAYVYAGSFYIDGETGDIEVGVEDEDGDFVAVDAADQVTLDFT